MRLASLSILTVWLALGGGPIRHGRSAAFWRGGRRDSVAIDSKRNLWHDFVMGEGGGCLRLVEVALGLDRPAALRWLQDCCDLDGPTPRSPQERKAALEAVRASRRCESLRQRLARQLSTEEGHWFREYHRSLRRVLAALSYESTPGERLARLMDWTELTEQRFTHIEGLRAELLKAPCSTAGEWEERYAVR